MTPDRRGSALTFHSILFDDGSPIVEGNPEPEFFGDLHLDQIFASLTAGHEEYDLAPFFYQPLRDVEAVHYRHHVVADLEREPVLAVVRAFADRMRAMRKHLVFAEQLHYARQKQRWFLEAVAVYCRAVASFRDELSSLELRSRGFLGLRPGLGRHESRRGGDPRPRRQATSVRRTRRWRAESSTRSSPA